MTAGATCAWRESPRRFGTFVAVDDLDLTIPSGSFFALLGPSGCGKTTTLRMVAGLEEPTDGHDPHRRRRRHRRQAVQAAGQHRLPELRAVPAPRHLRERRVRAAPARQQGGQEPRSRTPSSWSSSAPWPGASRRSSPAGSSSGSRWPARIVNRPAVLLLDEPLGALDLKLRRQMQIELKRIQTEVGLTFVHVTHDQEEAMTMADTIAVMNAGRIEQLGGPTRALRVARRRPSSRTSSASPTSSGPACHGHARRRPACSTSRAARSRCPPTRRASGDDDLLIGVRPGEDPAGPAGGRRSRAGATRSPAASSPTPASPGSAPSTSSGCRGARS